MDGADPLGQSVMPAGAAMAAMMTAGVAIDGRRRRRRH